MSLNFPNTPTLNQIYQAEGMTFSWNGTVWVLVIGNAPGTGELVFATTPEALAGTVTDKMMSPALVQARSGVLSSPVLAGLPTYTFTGIPVEATKITINMAYAGGKSAGGGVRIYPNSLNTGYVSNQTRLTAGGAIVVSENYDAFVIGMPSATDNCAGTLRLNRAGASGFWYADGQFRMDEATQVLLTGTVQTAAVGSVMIAAFPTAFQEGSAVLRWEI